MYIYYPTAQGSFEWKLTLESRCITLVGGVIKYKQLKTIKTIKKYIKMVLFYPFIFCFISFLTFQMPFSITFLSTLDKSIIDYHSIRLGPFIDFRRSLLRCASTWIWGSALAHSATTAGYESEWAHNKRNSPRPLTLVFKKLLQSKYQWVSDQFHKNFQFN